MTEFVFLRSLRHQEFMMHSLSRRSFLGTTIGGVAAALSYGPSAFGQNAVDGTVPLADAGPETLILSLRHDPTTTMTIQWVGKESAADTSIQYSTLENPLLQIGKTITKPIVNNYISFRVMSSIEDEFARYVHGIMIERIAGNRRSARRKVSPAALGSS